MSHTTEYVKQLVRDGYPERAKVYASIVQAEALERIADALEALVNPNEAGS